MNIMFEMIGTDPNVNWDMSIPDIKTGHLHNMTI